MDLDVDIVEVENIIEKWVAEVETEMFDEDEDWGAWDDVNGEELPVEGVKAARMEEVTYMQNRELWGLKPIKPRRDCFY